MTLTNLKTTVASLPLNQDFKWDAVPSAIQNADLTTGKDLSSYTVQCMNDAELYTPEDRLRYLLDICVYMQSDLRVSVSDPTGLFTVVETDGETECCFVGNGGYGDDLQGDAQQNMEILLGIPGVQEALGVSSCELVFEHNIQGVELVNEAGRTGVFTEADGTIRRLKDGIPHCEDAPAIELPSGKRYWKLNGIMHREDGPAFERVNSDGVIIERNWYKDGLLHREDGPAVDKVFEDGSTLKEWYSNGLLHREGGPAVEQNMLADPWGPMGAGVSREWRSNGILHREDGPAVEWANGTKMWILNDEVMTEEEWRRRTSR